MAVVTIRKGPAGAADSPRETTCTGCGSRLSYTMADAQTMPSRPGDDPGDKYIKCPECPSYVCVARRR